MPEEKKNDGFLLGLAIGGIIGAAAAFLLDKEDGEKLKKLIKNKGKLLIDNLENFSEVSQEKIVDTVTEVKEKVQEIPTVVSDQAVEVKENVTDKVEDLEKSGKSTLRRFFVKAGKKLAK